MDFQGKIFAVYKPKGPTSYDIIRKIKELTGEKRVGHAGTLDPLAFGVLIVGIGREATKKLGEIVGQEKEYIAKIKLGEISTTDDAEGKKIKVDVSSPPSRAEIEAELENFIGEIEQVPPQFSAIKLGGRPAYKAARRGEEMKLKPRKVFIKNIEIISYEFPVLELKVVCGKGVYIRSLSRDLGEKLKTGGYVLELERTRIGEFTAENAIKLK